MVLLNYNTYLNKPLKLVEKTFAFYRKSTKTVKVFTVQAMVHEFTNCFVCYRYYVAQELLHKLVH